MHNVVGRKRSVCIVANSWLYCSVGHVSPRVVSLAIVFCSMWCMAALLRPPVSDITIGVKELCSTSLTPCSYARFFIFSCFRYVADSEAPRTWSIRSTNNLSYGGREGSPAYRHNEPRALYSHILSARGCFVPGVRAW